jgi:hypothetical protein
MKTFIGSVVIAAAVLTAGLAGFFVGSTYNAPAAIAAPVISQLAAGDPDHHQAVTLVAVHPDHHPTRGSGPSTCSSSICAPAPGGTVRREPADRTGSLE